MFAGQKKGLQESQMSISKAVGAASAPRTIQNRPQTDRGERK